MSPQFVDFNADGINDIVVGIFDGSPHLARGTKNGFEQPTGILDREGARIVLNEFWNLDAKKWEKTKRCDPDLVVEGAEGHLTSAVAMDLDGDGDLDLLLGDHKSGRIHVRRNEGKKGEPAFATRNENLLVDGKPTDVPGTVATLRLVDWNGDGLMDLAAGSMGVSFGAGPGGGVYLFLNNGDAKTARFGMMQTLLAASPKGANRATRPDAGLYMDFADVDSDGDLDMAVGGHSIWTLPVSPLSAEDTTRLASMKRELESATKTYDALFAAAEAAAAGLEGKAAEARRDAHFKAHEQELVKLSQDRARLQKEIAMLVPGPQRSSAVWLYENRTRKSTQPQP